MQADPRSGAGGVVTAPRHQAERQAVTTAGPHLLTSEGQEFQPCRLLTARLSARYRLAIAFAVIYAEQMWRGGR